jgi:hypothetical protein
MTAFDRKLMTNYYDEDVDMFTMGNPNFIKIENNGKMEPKRIK